ncbi:calcium-activated chloride channel regulator 1-like [Asterias rubens]|uniref:calcium-activated chloride channel regulator 1-like n=1 Tax=Asterias rubens TaxID=7604 RepID=UPI001455D47A|nr:calcium-activated chloride channel regulator 1-like [Asterias rubens]
MDTTLLALLLLFAVQSVVSLTRPNFITLKDNGYTGITVAIHNQVMEDEQLIKRLKDMFTEGSKYLYEATRNRAYFKEVTILVPKTWSSKPEYELPGGITFDNADVIVAPPNPRWAPLQYTKQYEGCGKQGVHIHFMDAFLTDPNTELYYGPLGRTFVHEWGHFRWGLFDEYADPVGDPDNYQEFYFSPSTQSFEGVRCSYGHTGQPLIFLPESLAYRHCAGNSYIGYEDGCVFYVSREQKDVTASIMYSTYPLQEITKFCDVDGQDESSYHNREAPNKHNRLCSRRSNWEILKEHEDFKNGNNPATEIGDQGLVPSFTIVQHGEARVVLLLDTSGSMKNDQKFLKMISSSANFLSSIVIDGSSVGIVEFNFQAFKLKELTAITSDSDRDELLQALPDKADGWTAIGDGLLKAIEVLSTGSQDPKGGIIMLISDGEEKHGADSNPNPHDLPYVADVMDDVINSGVIVDTLAFSQGASTLLPSISKATGGKTFFYSNEPGSNTLYDAFAATMERGDVIDADKRVQLTGTSWSLASSEERDGSFFMDTTLGRRTEFSFSWTKKNVRGIDVTITTPSGRFIDSSYEGYGVDTSFRILTVKIRDIAEAGSWKYTVVNWYNEIQEIAISISSHPASDDVDPIVVTSELSGSVTDFANGEPLTAFAEIRQGFSPMIYANVWATIERPAGYDPVRLRLLDNGAGADITKNDGVYSRTFTEFSGVGYYGIRIDVDNNDGDAIIIDSTTAFSKARPIVDPDQAFNLPAIGGVKIPFPGAQPEEPTGRPAPSFSRGTSGGSSYVKELPAGFTPGGDYFPPDDVLDLRVKQTVFSQSTVVLTWTAPGDDLDNGAASLYEIIRAESVLAWQNDSSPGSHRILNSTDILNGSISTPLDFGNLEEYTILVPIPKGANVVSYAFVLRAFDDAGNPSGFSNAVQAVLRETIPQPPSQLGLAAWEIALIVIGAVVAALLIVLGVAYLIKTHKRKEVNVEDTVYEVNKEEGAGGTSLTKA